MPSRELWNKIKALMDEYEKGFDGEEAPPKGSKDEDAINDGGQKSLSDMDPEIDTPEPEEAVENKEKKRAKIAMYGSKLKKMGY